MLGQMHFRPVLLICSISYDNIRIIHLQILFIERSLVERSGYRIGTHFPFNSLFDTWEYNNGRYFTFYFYVLIRSHFAKLSFIYLISKRIFIHRSVMCRGKGIHNLIYHVIRIEIGSMAIFYNYIVHIIIAPIRPNIFKG